jgi:hypothetical protein
MRHDSDHPSVRRLDGGDTIGRSVRVERVLLRRHSLSIDVSDRDRDSLCTLPSRVKRGPPLPMSNSDGQQRAVHSLEEDRVLLRFDPDRRHPRLEPLAPVDLERRPVLRARDDHLQLREELASVADSQSKGIVPVEERLELLAGDVVKQDRLGPAVSGAEDIPVGEATAGGDASEGLEGDLAGDDVGHVDVDGLEARGGKSPGHLDVAVNTLLSKDGDLGLGRGGGRRGRAGGGVDEGEEGAGKAVLETWRRVRKRTSQYSELRDRKGGERGRELTRLLGAFEDRVKLLLGSGRIVSLSLHLVRGLGPHLLELSSGRRIDLFAVVDDLDALVGVGLVDLRDDVDVATREAGSVENVGELEELILRDLEDGSELLVEKGRDRRRALAELVEVDLRSDSAGKAHLGDGGEETSVRSVVIGEDGVWVVGLKRLDGSEEGADRLGVLDVGRGRADLLEDLREGGSAETLLAAGEVEENEDGLAAVGPELGRPSKGNVIDGSEGGDDDGHGGGDLSRLADLVLPLHLHRHRVLPDGDPDAESRAELHPDRLDGGVETGSLSWMRRGRHPVGRELDLLDGLDRSGGEVGEGLGDGHSSGGGWREESERGTLAASHSFSLDNVVKTVRRPSDGDVGDGDLPRTDHLVSTNESGDGSISDGDEVRLGADGRKVEDAVDGLGEDGVLAELGQVFGKVGRKALVELDPTGVDGDALEGELGRLAEEGRHLEVDGLRAEEGVGNDELLLLSSDSDDGEGASLSVADRLEVLEVVSGRGDGENVSLLAAERNKGVETDQPLKERLFGKRGNKPGDKQGSPFVAPDLHRAHSRIVDEDISNLELPSQSRVVDQLRQSVAQPSSPDIVDHRDRVLFPSPVARASIDNHLTPPLHLRILPLDTRKVELGRRRSRGHRRGRSSSETDEHARSSEDDDVRVGGDGRLEGVRRSDVAETTGEHDGLVVASDFEGSGFVEGGLGGDGKGKGTPESERE